MNHELNVLLVDDDRLVRYVTGTYFKRIGYKLDIAENGLVAIDKVKEKMYDLILMDVRMPVMNGLDATRAIRELETESGNEKRARIVAITASSAREECLDSGMNDYFQKPILMDHIHQILSDM
jgi:CheY-like chemotaxis protein